MLLRHGWGVLARLTFAVFVATLFVLGVFALVPDRRVPDGLDAARVAGSRVGAGAAEAPRRDGNEWEVDVVRPNGSLVEVTIGDRLELLGFDEELGPGGGRAPNELTGYWRLRAARAARAVVAGGEVLGVERERDGELEVALRCSNGARVEVGLDGRLRVIEVDPEHWDDES
jgi:hypothetical protein